MSASEIIVVVVWGVGAALTLLALELEMGPPRSYGWALVLVWAMLVTAALTWVLWSPASAYWNARKPTR